MVDNEDEGARLTRQEENRELIAKHRMGTIPTAEREKVMEAHRLVATVEPRGCPTPGSCSAVEELSDLKQRLLPQFQGRAQRAEHERDALLEELIIHRTTIANLHGEINKMQNAAPSATGATDAEVDEFVRVARTFSDEHYQNALVAELRRVYHALALQDAPVDHSYDRSASISEGRYVCTCGACSRPDWAQQLPGAELYDRAARYEYIRKLNLREFAALYDAAMRGERFDDVVDRYRMKGERSYDASQPHSHHTTGEKP
jgi:hypothetical protein